MSVEIRPAREDEMEQFMHVASTSLIMKPGTATGMRPEYTLCCFEDENLATSYATWPLTIRFNGNAVPVAGITHVGTLPVYRRRGYLRKITARHFELLHEQGERPIAVLWATMAAIYQRYGYAVVSTSVSYNVEPRYLEFSFPQPVKGRFREVGDDELALLVELYRKFRAERTGYIHRARTMWDAGVLAPAPAGGHLSKVVYQENGEPLGYVIYTVDFQPPPATGTRLTIRDLVWTTISAYRTIWDHLANMDLIADIVWTRVPSDDPLPHLLLEPRKLYQRSNDGLLGRIIDVDKALPARHYTEEGILTFEIIDDLCPWNSGRWKLETSTGGSTINRTSEEPQLLIPISTLAMLVFGQISANEAARMARLDIYDYGALSSWDRIMRTIYRPACADIF